ncbi:MAG: DUF4143 domain-containing protein [Eubacteriales bacterium]|nr:DUF4143 domain-containing protein [Eubacteriales bacterium]
MKQRQIAAYCQSIIHTEIAAADGVRRDCDKVEQVLRSYARHLSTQASIKTISSDVAHFFAEVNRKTVAEYLDAMRSIFVIDELSAWSPALRFKTAVASSPCRHFVDPAIAAYFLDANAEDLIYDMETFGPLFESPVIRDLRVYTGSLDGRVHHYRDHSGLEVDAILHLPGGQWAAIEVKLGNRAVDYGASNLLKLSQKIDTDLMNAPSFLAVITANGYAYRRQDGVCVIPIGCLRE